MKWWQIRAEGEETTEVLIYGDIGNSWWGDSVTAKELVEKLQELKDQNIVVRINSYGGSVSDGLAIYNALKRHPKDVSVTIDGVAMSIASLIAMAGNTVRMSENTMFMIHAPWGMAVGNSSVMREYADLLDKYAKSMSASYAAKTGRAADEIYEELLADGQDHYFSASEAKEAGFIDEIIGGEQEEDEEAARYRAAAISRFNAPAAVAAHYQPKKEPGMTKKTDPAPVDNGQTGAPSNVTDIETAAQSRERDRIQARNTEISGIFSRFMQQDGIAELHGACIADVSITAEQARAKLLAKLGEGATPLAGGRVEITKDETDKFRASAIDSLLARGGVDRLSGNGVSALSIDLNGNSMRGASLLDIARACLRRAGKNPDGMDKREIVAAAFQTTGDFPVLLENVMHKTLLRAYLTAPDTWPRFCVTGTLSDFRPHTRYRSGSLGNLEALNEHGEIKHKAIPDGEKASITATTKGNIVAVTRQAIINDDLGALTSMAQSAGRAAKRTIEADVYALLALNSGLGPLLTDGKSLFHADHGNITTGAAIAMAAIDADRVAMGSQKDVGGNDFLDLRPAVLLVGLALGGAARTINNAEYDPDTANKLQKPNMVRGLFRDVVDTPRLTGNRRYLFADPADAPVIEVAFLDGKQEPFLEAKDGWDVDGAELKVRLDYAVAGIDYRGAVTNAGQ